MHEVFVTTLIMLLFSHFLFDFPLQNDYTAIHKNPWHRKLSWVDGTRQWNNMSNPIWIWPMLSHCTLHSVPVFLLTNSYYLMAFMFVSHFVIDVLKCKEVFTYHQDQVLHLFVILCIATAHGLII